MGPKWHPITSCASYPVYMLHCSCWSSWDVSRSEDMAPPSQPGSLPQSPAPCCWHSLNNQSEKRQFTDLIMQRCHNQCGQGEENNLRLQTPTTDVQSDRVWAPVCVPVSLVHGWLLQLWLCRVIPWQSRPPFLGGGAEQVLLLCLTPPPHWASHSDHSVHCDQWP